MDRRRTSPGWSSSGRSSRTYPCSTSPAGPTARFSRADFVFDPKRDRYTCPAGKQLVQFRRTYATPRTGITEDGTRLYRASKRDCDACRAQAAMLPEHTGPQDPARHRRGCPRRRQSPGRHRRLSNSPAIAARRSRCCSPTSSASCRLGRLRLRGPCGARDEFLLAATAQNLRKLAKLMPAPSPMPA